MHPHSLTDTFSTPANSAACRTSIRQGSQSFYLASLLLPVAVREPAYAVYAFCRMADDLIDRSDGGPEAIADLEAMLDRIYAGRPRNDFVERGFADVARRHAIPREIPAALIEGLAWDAGGRRYESLSGLNAYAVRVAGTVGLMMTLVMGGRDPHVMARAIDLGVAMQLTNIARDIGEDARNGRIYMPLAWLRGLGVDHEAWLKRPEPRPQIRTIVDRLLAEADRLYDRALPGIAALPSGCRLGINTARLLYREIGRNIAAGTDPVTIRAVTTRQQKLKLVAEAIAARPSSRSGLGEPALAEAAFLVEAVAAAPSGYQGARLAPWWDIKARSERMIELLSGFSAREAATRPARSRSIGGERRVGAER